MASIILSIIVNHWLIKRLKTILMELKVFGVMLNIFYLIIEAKTCLNCLLPFILVTFRPNYLKKLLKQRLPDLTNIMENKKINFNEVFDLWIKSVSQQNKRIVMTIEEVPPQERNSVTVAVEGFSNFIDQVVLKC